MTSASIHSDVAQAIGQQVEQMILQAKKDSEARVRHELGVARGRLQQMEAHIADLSERVGRCVRSNGSGAGGQVDPSQTVDRAFLSQKIKQLEQKWGSEVKALKQDLHRTILAHNHNSDLMRHHRDALDEARRKLDAQTQPKAEQVDAQIEKVDRMLRAGQAKQRALDALTERLTQLEQQVGDVLPGGSAISAGMMPPGIGGMMPPGLPGATGATATTKKAAKKDGEPPSEDEVRQRLMQAVMKGSPSGGAIGGPTFNAEAPVFIPRGAAEEASASPTSKLDAGNPAVISTTSVASPTSDEPKDLPVKEATEEAAEAES
mmetsp:Transcript_98732/g.175758  ORF Transcript_98732/g.175758 Transcript_98732/m.175758 type:complete len:319 (-) Transcript_98732:115-1071(-)